MQVHSLIASLSLVPVWTRVEAFSKGRKVVATQKERKKEKKKKKERERRETK